MKIQKQINKDLILDLAGEIIFLKGIYYYENDLVEIISISDTIISGEVLDSKVHICDLFFGVDDKILGHCTCSPFKRLGFCKHLVALGLTVKEYNTMKNELVLIQDPKIINENQSSKAKLKYINDFHQNLKLFYTMVKSVYRFDRFNETIELSEYFIKRLEKSHEYVDDSTGLLGSILKELKELHLNTSLKAKHKPI